MRHVAFLNGFFEGRIRIPIRADRVQTLHQTISVNHFFDKGDIS